MATRVTSFAAEGRARLSGILPTGALSHPILYKRLYIPIYIFTRTHTYLTFFPFHVVYSPYVRRECRCARLCAPAIRTERSLSSIYVFLERVKLLYLSFLLFAAQLVALRSQRMKYFVSIYDFNFRAAILQLDFLTLPSLNRFKRCSTKYYLKHVLLYHDVTSVTLHICNNFVTEGTRPLLINRDQQLQQLRKLKLVQVRKYKSGSFRTMCNNS